MFFKNLEETAELKRNRKLYGSLKTYVLIYEAINSNGIKQATMIEK